MFVNKVVKNTMAVANSNLLLVNTFVIEKVTIDFDLLYVALISIKIKR